MNGEEWNRSVKHRIKNTDLCIDEIKFTILVSICIKFYFCSDVNNPKIPICYFTLNPRNNITQAYIFFSIAVYGSRYMLIYL